MRPHVVLASTEVWPFVMGGGIGRHVHETARVLAESADVTVLTRELHRSRHDELRAAGDPRLPGGVTFRWVPEPPDAIAPFRSWFHAHSAAFWTALAGLLRERPAALVEFEDYRGLGAVTAQAARSGAPELASTIVATRLHTTWEMTAVLDRAPVDQAAASWVMALERTALLLADRLISPGDATLRAYRRFYGGELLDGPVATIPPLPPAAPAVPGPAPAPAADGVRLLYVGRLQEVKGVRSLVRAVRALDAPDVTLTLVGGDTETGPAGTSMRAHLEREAEGDGRISFRERVDPAALPAIYDDHHIVVMPSRFESFGFVAREARARSRPVLVTPVGGLTDAVTDGIDGWIAPDLTDEALLATLRRAVADREAIDRMIAAGPPPSDEAHADAALAERYLALAAEAPARPAAGAQPDDGGASDAPLTVLVDATRGGDAAATLDALEALDGERAPEVVLLAPEPAEVEADCVERVHAVERVADGETLNAARSRALAARRATGPVLLIEAGTVLDPVATIRLRRALRASAAPYATAYGTGLAIRNAPIGNFGATITAEPWAAASVVLLAPEAAARPLPEPDAPGADDAAVLAAFSAQQRVGSVVPDVLVGRVRPGMPVDAAPRLALAAGPDLLQDR